MRCLLALPLFFRASAATAQTTYTHKTRSPFNLTVLDNGLPATMPGSMVPDATLAAETRRPLQGLVLFKSKDTVGLKPKVCYGRIKIMMKDAADCNGQVDGQYLKRTIHNETESFGWRSAECCYKQRLAFKRKRIYY